MNMTLMIQIGLMLCVISIVIMGLVFFIAYDHQLRRRQALQYHLDEKKVILFLFKGLPFFYCEINVIKNRQAIVPKL